MIESDEDGRRICDVERGDFPLEGDEDRAVGFLANEWLNPLPFRYDDEDGLWLKGEMKGVFCMPVR